MRSIFFVLLLLLLSVSVLTAEVYHESTKVSKTIFINSGGVIQESVSAVLNESLVNHRPYQHSLVPAIPIMKVRYRADLLTGFNINIIDQRLKYAIEF